MGASVHSHTLAVLEAHSNFLSLLLCYVETGLELLLGGLGILGAQLLCEPL